VHYATGGGSYVATVRLQSLEGASFVIRSEPLVDSRVFDLVWLPDSTRIIRTCCTGRRLRHSKEWAFGLDGPAAR
jgi:hypothetical protein